MLENFVKLLGLVRKRNCLIDDRVFRLHTLFTPTIFFFFFIIITTKQISGDPIDCETNRDEIKATVLNTFCLIHYTYAIGDAFSQKPGKEVAAPGVKYGPETDEIRYNYYQWIWFIFFLEALLFYIPRWVWKGWENGNMGHLTGNFKEYISNKEKIRRKTYISNYLIKNVSQNNTYSKHYLICLVLAFLNVLLQMFCIDLVFNGEFYTYGPKVFLFLYEEPENRSDALIKVFPRVTKCRFNKFGPSGSLMNIDALCVLPLNMYNELIFVFLWFWFAILAILLFITILIKLVLMMSPFLRLFYIKNEFKLDVKDKDIKCVEPKDLNFGETFVLCLIKENTSLMFSKELVKHFFIEKRKILSQTNKRESKESKESELNPNNETENTSEEKTKLIKSSVIEMNEKKVGSEKD